MRHVSRLVAIGCLVLTATVWASPPSPASTPSIPDRLGWPTTTKIVRLVETAHVFRTPDDREPLGKIVHGTRAEWVSIVEVTDPASPSSPGGSARRALKRGGVCLVWVELRPAGWVCASSLAPTREVVATGVQQPPMGKHDLVPRRYYMVKDLTPAFASTADVLAYRPRPKPLTKVMLSSLGTRDIAGATYHLTNKGLVDAGRMIELAASEFSGIELGAHGGPDLAQPIGFVFTSHRAGAPVRPEPLATAKQVASKPFRSVVSIGVERDGFVSIGDGQWVDRTMVRVIRTQPVPAAVAPNARWIDVDLDEQTVVAYAGARPMFATLASTGRRTGTTPVGVFRVRAKAATMRMAGPPDTRESYDVGEIPWAVRLKKGIFFHASYWHDGFGGVRSHGCVNLSPKDARFIYDWVDPTVPPGWSEIEVERTGGTIVRIRDAAHPEPAQYAYADETDEADEAEAPLGPAR